ncbi:hypothetical protein B0T16DRAFT_11398 [Cercophora newfieldiana]|uniref:Uncharacterized protein n=1 Tax=Cercophora newfieldiana TaxID=92897 RepID=A0AA40CYR0_9PEZI|nr:hypothetical protein B0T16DRAFT_11398 [Cercophora newfieldiana]
MTVAISSAKRCERRFVEPPQIFLINQALTVCRTRRSHQPSAARDGLSNPADLISQALREKISSAKRCWEPAHTAPNSTSAARDGLSNPQISSAKRCPPAPRSQTPPTRLETLPVGPILRQFPRGT